MACRCRWSPFEKESGGAGGAGLRLRRGAEGGILKAMAKAKAGGTSGGTHVFVF